MKRPLLILSYASLRAEQCSLGISALSERQFPGSAELASVRLAAKEVNSAVRNDVSWLNTDRAVVRMRIQSRALGMVVVPTRVEVAQGVELFVASAASEFTYSWIILRGRDFFSTYAISG